MATSILLLHYNNYFNRTVKKLSTLQEYMQADSNAASCNNINFVPGDGITTSLVLGKGTNPTAMFDSGANYDYAVVFDSTDPNYPILSRWFIMESVRTREGQYDLSLKRDVLAEHFDEVMDAPCYIEKGIINDTSNPLIFNPEDISVNQIKQAETPLIDETNCAWLVGYIKKNLGEKTATGTMTKDLENAYDFDDLYFKDAIDSDDSQLTHTETIIIPDSMTLNWIGYSYGWPFDAYYGYTGNFLSDNNVSWQNVGNQTNPNWNLLNSALITFPEQSASGNTTATQIASRMSQYSNSIPVSVRDSLRAYLTSNIKLTNNLKEVSDLSSTDTYSQLISKYNGALVIKNNVVYRLNISIESSSSSNYGLYNYLSNAAIGSYFDYYISDLTSYFGKTFSRNTPQGTGQKLRSDLSYRRLVITASKLDSSGAAYTITIPQSASRMVTEDALYDIFAVPYIPNQYSGSKTASFIDPNGATINVNSEAMLFIVQQLMTQLNIGSSGAEAYDLQVLPYCPIIMPADNDLRKLDTKSYRLITQEQAGGGSRNAGFVIFAPKANFTKDISIEIGLHEEKTFSKEAVYDDLGYRLGGVGPISSWPKTNMLGFPAGMPDHPQLLSTNLYLNGTQVSTTDYVIRIIHGMPPIADTYQIVLRPTAFDAGNYDTKIIFTYKDDIQYSPIDLKIANETDFMRLTSPNFNGMFEFKKTKLADGLHYVNIDCTYKPYNPYIKLNPDFSFMYGDDFNDSTGLICSGDFSISVLNDAWINYQLNNKNYQAIFNRQIQNLDINNQIALEQMQLHNIAGVVGGTIGGGVSGAITGAKAGPWGAVAGAALGTIGGAALSGIGASLNRSWLNRQQSETRSYTTDMYNYQLGNIKALPQSISKSDPLTYNNKIWPILEQFSCTETEKEVLFNKIAYNGMNIMAIGRLGDYSISSELDRVFVKGQLIRLDTVKDDFHVIEALYEEINKGFYVPQGE